jgi:hypothetical protein
MVVVSAGEGEAGVGEAAGPVLLDALWPADGGAPAFVLLLVFPLFMTSAVIPAAAAATNNATTRSLSPESPLRRLLAAPEAAPPVPPAALAPANPARPRPGAVPGCVGTSYDDITIVRSGEAGTFTIGRERNANTSAALGRCVGSFAMQRR